VIVCRRRRSIAARYRAEAVVLVRRACLRRLVFPNAVWSKQQETALLSIPRSFFSCQHEMHACTYARSFSVTYTADVSLADLDFLVLSWCSSLTLLSLSAGSAVCVFSPVLCGLHSFPFYQNKAWCSVFVFSPWEAFFTRICLGQFVASLAGFILFVEIPCNRIAFSGDFLGDFIWRHIWMDLMILELCSNLTDSVIP